MKRRYSWMLLAALCAVGLHAGTASATLSLNQAAAMVVTPFVTSGADEDLVTADAVQTIQSLTTVTNAGTAPIDLAIEVADGRSCRSVSTDCPVTGNETVLFWFEALAPGFTRVHFTCSNDPQGQDNPPIGLQTRQLDIASNQGFMVVTAHDPSTHAAISSNVLFSDWVTIDYNKLTAYGAEAITFQGVSALANNGDTNYSFDGKEYSTFPAQLASNFYATAPGIAPGPDGNVTGELILLTLDVTFNTSYQNPVELFGNVYDNKELSYNFEYNFNCSTIVDLDQLSPAFTRASLLSDVGHFDLTPVEAPAGDPGHERQFGTGGNSRIRPAVGWIVQSIQTGGQIPSNAAQLGGTGPPFGAGTGSWARTLGTSTVAFSPLAGDTPTLSTP